MIKLKEGQEIIALDGSKYIIEKGDYVKESHGSDLPNVDKHAQTLVLKGKGFEQVEMDYRDGHNALFYDGLLCGFSWFRNSSVANNYEEYKKQYGSKVKWDGIGIFTNSRPATMFVKLYGKEGEALLSEAIEYYNNEEA
jgi:hypothetical protein